MSPNLFAGIVRIDETDFAVGLRDYPGNITRTTQVKISGGLQAGDLKKPPPDFQNLLRFFNEDVPEGSQVRLCVEFEGIIQPRNSPFSKLCVLLSTIRLGALGFGVNTQGFFVQRLPEKIKKDQKMKDEIWLIPEHTGRAWHEFNHGKPLTPSDAALAVAEIAMRRHLYYYLSSRGTVQSSMDIIHVLRHGCPGKVEYVLRGGDDLDAYGLMVTDETKMSESHINHVSLKYLTTKKQFSYLSENQALKFAVLQVCRQHSLKLYCLTDRDGSDSIKATGFIAGTVPLKEEYLVWPAPTVPPSDVRLDFER